MKITLELRKALATPPPKPVGWAGPRDVVQLISYTTNRASFNRITEAAGLQVER